MCSVTVSSIRYVIPPLIAMYTHLTQALNNYPLMLLIIKRTAIETALLGSRLTAEKLKWNPLGN